MSLDMPDSDVVPSSACPGDLVDKLLRTLYEFQWAAKVGPEFGLTIFRKRPGRRISFDMRNLTGENESDAIVFAGR